MAFNLLQPAKGSRWIDDAGRPASVSATVVGQTVAIPGAMTGSFLPETRSSSRQRGRTSSGSPPLKRADSTLMMTIAASPEGTLEHWKYLAKKAEADLILEQEQHRRDSEQDFEALTRLSRRISALEASANERDLSLSTHKKKIKVLRDQLDSASKRFERELEFVKLQAEEIKLKLSLVVAERDQKIGGLKQELQVSILKKQLLQSQLDELLRVLEEPLDRLRILKPLETRDDSNVNDSSFGFLKRVMGLRGKRSHGKTSQSGSPVNGPGFLSSLVHRKDPQPLSDTISNNSELLRSRVEKSYVAEKIIQLREENARLTKELSEKSQHLNLVTREAERLKRGVREVVNQQAAQESLKVRIAELATERDAANFELQEADKMLASLSELESSVARSATSDEVDQLMLSTTPSQLEPIHVDGQQHASLIKINDAGLENSRWFLVLKRLHQSFGQLLFKVDATYNLACHLQKEKDALHAMVQGIRGELLSSTVKERPESPGLLKMLGFGRGQENKDSTSTYQEQDHFQIFAIIKEQKIRLLRAQGTAEECQRTKNKMDAVVSDYEAKLLELREKLQQMELEKGDVLKTLFTIYDFLGGSSLGAGVDESGSNKYSVIVSKIQELLREKEQVQAANREYMHATSSLEQQLRDVKQKLVEMHTLASAVDGILDLDGTYGRLHGSWELKIAAEALATRAKTLLTGDCRDQEKILDKLVKQKGELDNLRESHEKDLHEIAELTSRVQEMEAALDFMGTEADIEEPRLDRVKSQSVIRIKQMKLRHDSFEATSKQALAQLANLQSEKDEFERRQVANVSDVADKLRTALAEKEEAERQRLEHAGKSNTSQKELDRLKQHLKDVHASIRDHARPVAVEDALKDNSRDSDETEVLSALECLKTELSVLRTGKDVDDAKLQGLLNQILEAESALIQFSEFVERQFQLKKDALGKGENATSWDPQSSLAGKVRHMQGRVVELQVLSNEERLRLKSDIDVQRDRANSLDIKLGEIEAILAAAKAECASMVARLKKEIRRLGGYDLDDEVEHHRRQVSAEKVKEILTSGAAISAKQAPLDHPTLHSIPCNPLGVLATFEVELLVNSKVYQQLKIGGTMGGVCQAAVHYFHVDAAIGEVSFEDATMPGSQSSNMLLDLVLMPGEEDNPYESQPGDILGLCVKVLTFHDKNLREVLYNNNVIRTDEVMDAIRGQTIENFSLWPDLVSSWRWERSNTDRWTLVCVRWRFLLKNIFPELSEPLQLLAIGQHNLRASTALLKPL